MQITQMLVVLKIQGIVELTTDGDLWLFWNLDYSIMSGSLNNVQSESAPYDICLKLIRPHLDNHLLNTCCGT